MILPSSRNSGKFGNDRPKYVACPWACKLLNHSLMTWTKSSFSSRISSMISFLQRSTLCPKDSANSTADASRVTFLRTGRTACAVTLPHRSGSRLPQKRDAQCSSVRSATTPSCQSRSRDPEPALSPVRLRKTTMPQKTCVTVFGNSPASRMLSAESSMCMRAWKQDVYAVSQFLQIPSLLRYSVISLFEFFCASYDWNGSVTLEILETLASTLGPSPVENVLRGFPHSAGFHVRVIGLREDDHVLGVFLSRSVPIVVRVLMSRYKEEWMRKMMCSWYEDKCERKILFKRTKISDNSWAKRVRCVPRLRTDCTALYV